MSVVNLDNAALLRPSRVPPTATPFHALSRSVSSRARLSSPHCLGASQPFRRPFRHTGRKAAISITPLSVFGVARGERERAFAVTFARRATCRGSCSAFINVERSSLPRIFLHVRRHPLPRLPSSMDFISRLGRTNLSPPFTLLEFLSRAAR